MSATGLIRYLIVCLDCSVTAKETDYRPNRLEAGKAAVERFMLEYFDQNPISQVQNCEVMRSQSPAVRVSLSLFYLEPGIIYDAFFLHRCHWHSLAIEWRRS